LNPTETTAQPPSYRSPIESIRRFLAVPGVGPFLALLLTMAFFSLKSDRFLQGQNLSLVLQQVMVVGVLAIGQTLVILTAGIDLSVGTVMAFGQIVMTKAAIDQGYRPVTAILLGILACVAFGALNGSLVAGVRLPAFIVTLGTLNIAFALTHIYSDDLTYPPGTSGKAELPSALLFWGRTFTIGHTDITYGVVLMFVLFGLAWFALTQTAWGRHVYATGDDPEAARLTGIKTGRVLLSVYVVAGLMYGIAAWLLVSRTELGDPNAGQTTENLDSITAVVLGGTSLFGGRGTVIGTLIGVEVIYQYLVTGILVILAVSVDQLTHRRRL
jgi:fructose transport system permease protein